MVQDNIKQKGVAYANAYAFLKVSNNNMNLQ